MMLQTSPRFFQPRGLDRSKSVNTTSSSMPITPTISWWTVVPMEALLVQTCESSTKPTARSTFQALTTMKLLVLMWSLLQPSSTPLWEKSLESSMNMPTLGRDPPSIHQVDLNGLKHLLMKNPSKLVAPNLSLLWMDIHLDQATKRGNKIRRTNVHFSGPNDEDEHQNLSSDDNQVTHQEDVYSEPPEPLSYSLFQSHFQGSSTPNTQKIFLPKPIWEKLSKDQQQMILGHNRNLCPKVEALISQHPTRVLPLYPTNLHHNRQQNLSKCTPINQIKALLTPPKLRPPLLTLYWQWSINPFTPLMMMLQTSAMSFQSRGLTRFRSANDTSFSMPITPTNNW